MLEKLKGYLKGANNLEEDDIDNIRNYFNEVLNYIEADIDKPISKMEDIYNTFKDLYPYSGEVYRGVFIDTSWNSLEESKAISSFTNNKDVATNFAMRGDKGDAYLLTQQVDNALYLGELLTILEEKNILLMEDIQTFLGEDEVYCYINDSCNTNLVTSLY